MPQDFTPDAEGNIPLLFIPPGLQLKHTNRKGKRDERAAKGEVRDTKRRARRSAQKSIESIDYELDRLALNLVASAEQIARWKDKIANPEQYRIRQSTVDDLAARLPDAEAGNATMTTKQAEKTTARADAVAAIATLGPEIATLDGEIGTLDTEIGVLDAEIKTDTEALE